MLSLLCNQKDSYYRAAVGIATYRDGMFLVFERNHVPGSFQFSQGGRHIDEQITDSMWRELFEETGIKQEDVVRIDKHPSLLSYEYDTVRNLPWIGQTFSWYYLELKPETTINLSHVQDKEFTTYAWMTSEEVLNQVVGFRKPLYEEVFRYFKEVLIK